MQSFVAKICCIMLSFIQLMLQKIQLSIDFAAFLLFHANIKSKNAAGYRAFARSLTASHIIYFSCAFSASSMAFSALSLSPFPVLGGEKIQSTRRSSSPVLMI